jgi:ubiquinone/menaquinone biosynthesis C-methylase UbiE
MPRSGSDSYSAIARTYARVCEPVYFSAPARELLALLRVTSSTRLLDVGCGTGALGAWAARTIDDGGLLVAADHGIGMLAECRLRVPRAKQVACELPRLPHSDGAFDAVAAGFVLSHLEEPTPALLEMVRVLRPGGLVGVSSWIDTSAATAPGRLWQHHLEKHVAAEELEAVSARQLPSEAALSHPQELATALERAGLEIRELVVRELPVCISTAAYVDSRSVSSVAQHVHSRLPPAEWQRCLTDAADALAASFGEQLSFVLRACLACAARD